MAKRNFKKIHIEIGKRYGGAIVLRKTDQKIDNGNTLYECLTDQGETVLRPAYRIIKCIKRYNTNKSRGTYKGFPLWAYNRTKLDAGYRNKEFDIEIEDMIDQFELQNHKCALSGTKLYLEASRDKNSRNPNGASLDRIDSSKGYVKGNIQWVHKVLNRMKLDMKTEEFVEWCQKVVTTFSHDNSLNVITQD